MAEGETHVHVEGARGVLIGDGQQHNHFGGRRRFVLVVSTPELAQHPVAKPFVTAARNAVKKAGFEFAELPAGRLPAAHYRQRMHDFDIYVSLLGFCYGPVVIDDKTRSYAKLAYESAARSHRPHYVIVINPGQYTAPRDFFVDSDPRRQEKFRRDVLASDVVRYEVDDADQLETLLFTVLDNPPVRPAAQPGPPAVRPALDVKAAALASGLGVVGFLLLWLLPLGISAGWAAGVAVVATIGTYLGGRLTKNP